MTFNPNKMSNELHEFTINDVEAEQFYNRLRIIFTYYSSQSSKQDPCILREKSFKRFLVDSTLADLTFNQKHETTAKQTSKKDKIRNKPFFISFNKPLKYEQFLKILSKLVFSIRNKKSWDNIFQNQQKEIDLYKTCVNDKVLLETFKLLYEQIEQNTQFGDILSLCRNRQFYNQQTFDLIKKVKSILQTIYFHYFKKQDRHPQIKIQDLFFVLRRFSLEFQLVPQIMSSSDIFIVLNELVTKRSRNIYEQQIYEQKNKNRILGQFQWKEFQFIDFVKFLILSANLIKFKNQKFNHQKVYEQNNESILNLFQMITISKGFKQIKKSYRMTDNLLIRNSDKVNNSTLVKDSIDPQSRSKYFKSQSIQSQQQQLKFQPIRIKESKQLKIIKSVQKLFQILFQICQHDQTQKITLKQLQYFCSQFKITPTLISKIEMREIYIRILNERNYYIESDKGLNAQVNKQVQIHDEYDLLQLIDKAQYGLIYEEFLKVFIYGTQLTSQSPQFNHSQRLIYWIDHIYNQQFLKNYIKQHNLSNRNKQDKFIFNIDIITKKPTNKINNQLNFYQEYQSMYRKLKNSYSS